MRNSADANGAYLSPWRPLAAAWRHRDLVLRLAWRDIEARYRGSALGMLWAVAQPLVLLGVYTFVFGFVFNMRATRLGLEEQAAEINEANFAMLLFAGLILYNLFSDCVGKAPGVLRQNVTFVKKIVFPLEILPWSTLCMAIFNAIVATCVFAIFYGFIEGTPPVTVLLVPLVVLPLLLLILGISWALASIGLYIQDTQQVVGLVLTVALFTCPIFYPMEMVPEAWRGLLYINPLTVGVEMLREVVFDGIIPDPWIWLIYLGGGLLVAWVGHAWFMATRRGFADAI